MRGSKIELNGIDIHYERIGNGPHIVLMLPGALGDKSTMTSVLSGQLKQNINLMKLKLPSLAGTSRTDFNEILEGGLDPLKFTLIAWDPPGYGFSRPHQRNYVKEIYSKDADIAAALMKKLDFNFYSVLGWSDGGKTAIFLTSKYPGVVNKLVVWGVVSYGLQLTNRAFLATKNMTFWDKAVKKRYTDVYGDELELLWNKLVDDSFRNGITSRGYIVPKEVVEQIKCKVLVVHGDRDPLVALEHAQYLINNLSDSRLSRFPDASHNLHQTCEEQFHKLVTSFLLTIDN